MHGVDLGTVDATVQSWNAHVQLRDLIQWPGLLAGYRHGELGTTPRLDRQSQQARTDWTQTSLSYLQCHALPKTTCTVCWRVGLRSGPEGHVIKSVAADFA